VRSPASGTPLRVRAGIAQLGHIGEMHLRRWLELPPGTPEQVREEPGIEEFLGDSLRSTIEDILDAVAAPTNPPRPPG
jgi:hypothetical protein